MTSLRKRLMARLRGTGDLRGVAVLTLGTTGGRIIVFAAFPIITRLYTPGDFGVMAVYASVLALAASAASLRYDWAVPVARDDEETRALVTLSLGLAAALALVTAGIVVPFGGDFAAAVNAEELEPFMWLLPLGILGIGSYSTLSFLAVREAHFALIARTRVTQAVAQVTTQVGLGAAGVAPLGLLVGHLLGQSAGVLTLGRAAVALFRRTGAAAAGAVRRAAARFRRYPLLALPSAFISQGVRFVPPLLIATLYGTGPAGAFDLASRTVRIPLQLLSESIGQVYLSRVAAQARAGSGAMVPLILRYVAALTGLALIPSLVLLAFGPFLFELVFGSGWRQAGVFARILAVESLAQFVVSPISQTATVLQRHASQLTMDTLRLAGVVGVFVFAGVSDASVTETVTLYAVVMLLGYVALGMFHWRVALTEDTRRAGERSADRDTPAPG